MKTWVLLRGLMREARHWGDFPEHFQRTIHAGRNVTIDFPGNGILHRQSSLASVAGMADYCRLRLDELGHSPPYNVLALSLGAMVAVAWDKAFPGELDRLVLINTSLAPFSPYYQRLRPANYASLLGLLVSISPVTRERLILKLTSNMGNDSKRKAALLDQWVSYARECPVTRSNILRQLWAAAHYRPSPARPHAQALLLASWHDKLVDAGCSRTLARQWQCAIRMHPSAGHDLPLDDGNWVAEQIGNWMDGTDQTEPA